MQELNFKLLMSSAIQNWQLTLNFTPTLSKEKSISERSNFQFYPKDSTILKDIFSVKLNYNWRSYILKWRYRIATIKAFGDMEDKLKTIWFVDLDKILAYKWFLYSLAFISKAEKLRLIKLVEKILSNPTFNQNLAD